MAKSPRSVTSATQVLGPVLRRGAADLRSAESSVRLDAAGSAQALHDASRRLGSLLVAARPLFTSTDALEDQLRACRKAATPTRDTETLHRRVLLRLADEPAGEPALALRERLDRQLEGRRRRRWLRLVEYLDTPAFDLLARRLDAFSDLTPWDDAARRPASEALAPLLERQLSRLDRAMRRLAGGDDDGVDDVLRATRKRVEAARHLSDALVASQADQAKRTRKAMRRRQTVLVDLRDADAVVAFLDRELRSRTGAEERRILLRLRDREAGHRDTVRAELLEDYRPSYRRGSAS